MSVLCWSAERLCAVAAQTHTVLPVNARFSISTLWDKGEGRSGGGESTTKADDTDFSDEIKSSMKLFRLLSRWAMFFLKRSIAFVGFNLYQVPGVAHRNACVLPSKPTTPPGFYANHIPKGSVVSTININSTC